MKEKVEKATGEVYGQLEKMMPTSYEISRKNATMLPAEIVNTVMLPYPFYVSKGKGSRLWDVDGNEYIDLTAGFGPIFLGHSPDEVIAAAKDQFELGSDLGMTSPLQGKLAELLIEASPCAEMVHFCNTGTEATMEALRLARAHTGKGKLGIFVGSYHGVHDPVLVEADPNSDPKGPSGRSKFGAMGIPQFVIDNVLMLPYRDAAAFDLIRKNKDDLALVMIEPVQSSNPRTDVGPFLEELKEVCRECGVLFMLDEVITGMRLGGMGGAQEFFDVTPDLATFGKIIGGGTPVGAVAGSTEIMNTFKVIFAGGTFSGNPLTMTAGAAVLEYLKGHPEVYPSLAERSDRLADEINGFLKAEDMEAQLMNAQSIFSFQFTRKTVDSAWDLHNLKKKFPPNLFYAILHKNGVTIPGLHLFFTTVAHTDDDIDRVVAAMKKSFLELREYGLI
ncbi:MAG: aspartate aminotransferase family protein [Proteobacteria bacterium]|nr:aspartate aminotransferase family protein [Pseudomonadota bacterium]